MTPARRLDHFTESLISEMNRLAAQTGAVNLSSGYPDFDPPAELLAAAHAALDAGAHQYAEPWGDPALRRALAADHTRRAGLPIDPDAHLTVTCGGTEAMMAVLMALVDPGDRVVIFSPFYETYGVDTLLCGGQPVFIPMRPPEFALDVDALRGELRRGARALILCNPSNPSGKVFTRLELETIGALAAEYDTLVIADEIYEHIVFPPHVHTHFAALPGMFERTITCHSLSKTYSITGWRLGYTIAPPRLTTAIRQVHDYLTLCAPAPLQQAAVAALALPESYYAGLVAGYIRRRDLLLGGLQRAGLDYIPPQGAYFVLADIGRFGYASDRAFCEWLARQAGVAAVPGSYFFHEPVNHLVRLNFAKRDETIAEACRRLEKLEE